MVNQSSIFPTYLHVKKRVSVKHTFAFSTLLLINRQIINLSPFRTILKVNERAGSSFIPGHYFRVPS